MSWVAVGVGGATLVGGMFGAKKQSKAAKEAAQIQADAANRATELQRQMYTQNRADQEPWRAAGGRAIGEMGDADFKRDFTMADYQEDPGYAFRMAEANKAMERSAASRGGLQSGGTLKALSRYNQDYASNEYSNAYNRFNSDRDRRFGRLSSIAGMGQNANAQNAASGANYANNAGQNMMGAANAQGGAKIASANAWTSAINGATQNMTGLAMMGGMGGGGGGSSGVAAPQMNSYWKTNPYS